MFPFREERLNLKESLGSGNFGEVFPYQKDPTDLEHVVKRIIAKNSKTLINCFPEIIFGFSCDHPCIVPIQGYFVEEIKESQIFQVFLKMPRMKQSLFRHFQDRKRRNNFFTETEISQHFYALVCGLQYLHNKKIYHGDIRHDNLLLDDKGNLKIADIGIAKHVRDEDSYQTVIGQKGTTTYTAPEVLREKAKKIELEKADIWSLGVVILELCVFEYRLFNSSLPVAELQSRVNEELKKLEGKYDSNLISLMNRLLSLNPKNRPSLEEIKDELEKIIFKF